MPFYQIVKYASISLLKIFEIMSGMESCQIIGFSASVEKSICVFD